MTEPTDNPAIPRSPGPGVHAPVPGARPPSRAEFHGSTYVSGDAVAGDKIVQQPPREWIAPAQLPHDIAKFTGRTDQLAELDARADSVAVSGRPETVVLHGMPGVGKSAMAIHWACRNADRFPGGQLFVDLRGYSEDKSMTNSEALGRLLHGLNVPDEEIPADEDAKAALYRTRLARRPMLVVLDNAADPRQVEALRPGSSPTLVIVTGRTEPRDLVAWGAHAIRLDVFTPGEALALVTAVLGSRRVSAESSAAAELTARCAYLPIALRLALADLAMREQNSIADANQRLVSGTRLTHLTSEDGHSEVISAAFELSYRRLAPDERRAFRYLGLLRGPDFTADAVAALWAVSPAAAEGLLEALERANLVTPAAAGRHRLHDLLWEYASRLVTDEDDAVARQAAVHRHIVRQLTTAQDAGRYLDRHRRTIREEYTVPGDHGDPTARALRLLWFEAERANLLTSVEQAAEEEWRQMAWELADALFDYLDLRGYHHDNVWVHRLGLTCARGSEDLHAQVFMGHHLAVSLRELGEYPAALAEAQKALEITRLTQDPYGESTLRNTIGRIRYRLADYPTALAQTEQALDVRRHLGDPHGEAEILVNIADIQIVLARYDEALARAEQALAIRRAIGDQRGEGAALDCMGRAEFLRSDYHKALEHHNRALELHQQAGDRRGEAGTRLNIARCHRAVSAYAEAIDNAEQALAIHADMGDRQGEAELRAQIANVHWHTADYPEAERQASTALRIQQEIGDQHGEAESLRYLATVRQMTGRVHSAVYSALHALDICHEIGDRSGMADTFDLLTRCYRALSVLPMAERDARRALDIRREIGDRRGEADSRHETALNRIRLGDYTAALEESQSALAIRRDIGDRHGAAETLQCMARIAGRQGHYDRARKHAERALRIRESLTDQRGVGESLTELGDLRRLTADYKDARELVERARPLRAAIGDRYGEAECLTVLGRIEYALSKYEQALERFIEALRIRRTIGDRDGEAELLSEISITCWRTTQYDRALANAHAALKIRRDIASRDGEAEALINIAQVLRRKGRYADALRHTEQALAIRRDIGDRRGEAEALGVIALIVRRQHRYDVAERRAADALATCRAIGDKRGEAEALDALARVERDVGEQAARTGDLAAGQRWLDEAGAHARESRAIRERISDLRGLGDALHTMATTERATWSLKRQGEHLDRAARHAELALDISRRVQDRYGESAVLDTLAKIHLDAGRLGEALYRARQALEIEKSLADRFKKAKAYQLLGRVHHARGDLEEACADLEAARRIWAETDNLPAMRETLGYLAEAYDGLGLHEEAETARAEQRSRTAT
ncbi:MAG TPA: tetratricopeptide repeat protein [Streptosporangiaceae bacterium]|jgi:tetratricopeptide (TPR) repeat protein